MKTRSIGEPKDKLVNHAELMALTQHIATLIAALDVRLTACEAVRPVDPEVAEQAADYVRTRNGPAAMAGALRLVEDDEPVTSEGPESALDTEKDGVVSTDDEPVPVTL